MQKKQPSKGLLYEICFYLRLTEKYTTRATITPMVAIERMTITTIEAVERLFSSAAADVTLSDFCVTCGAVTAYVEGEVVVSGTAEVVFEFVTAGTVSYVITYVVDAARAVVDCFVPVLSDDEVPEPPPIASFIISTALFQASDPISKSF